MIDATLVFLLKVDGVPQVLLGYKKTGFGKGKYAGFGGKVETGEGVKEAALRELGEEAQVSLPEPDDLEYRAVLEFRFPEKPSWSQRVHAFVCDPWSGIPAESSEMAPVWFPVDEIPYPQMWSDARYWMPRLLAGERFRASFVFAEDNQTVDRVDFLPFDG